MPKLILFFFPMFWNNNSGYLRLIMPMVLLTLVWSYLISCPKLIPYSFLPCFHLFVCYLKQIKEGFERELNSHLTGHSHPCYQITPSKPQVGSVSFDLTTSCSQSKQSAKLTYDPDSPYQIWTDVLGLLYKIIISKTEVIDQTTLRGYFVYWICGCWKDCCCIFIQVCKLTVI